MALGVVALADFFESGAAGTTVVSGAFLQDANERVNAQYRIQNVVLFIALISLLKKGQNNIASIFLDLIH